MQICHIIVGERLPAEVVDLKAAVEREHLQKLPKQLALLFHRRQGGEASLGDDATEGDHWDSRDWIRIDA